VEDLIAELKTHIVETLEIEDVRPEEIDTDAPLFREGLGLDSIDALELVVMVERHYGIKMKKMAEARAAFSSVRTLARFVLDHLP
jgi:acyl carrier protein